MSSFTDAHAKLQLALDFNQGMTVTEGFQYIIGDYKTSEEIIDVLPKFYTDGISAPGRFQNPWYGIQRFGPYATAGIVHDYLYAFGPVLGYTRKKSDAVFKEALCVLSCPRWRASLVYLVLRLAGWGPWLLHRTKQRAVGGQSLISKLARRIFKSVQLVEVVNDNPRLITFRFSKGQVVRGSD